MLRPANRLEFSISRGTEFLKARSDFPNDVFVEDGQMSNDADREMAALERANSNLQNSLKRCQELVSELRNSLVANSNEPIELQDADDSEIRREL